MNKDEVREVIEKQIHNLYLVDMDGSIYSLRRKKVISVVKHKKTGYIHCHFWIDGNQYTRMVHRMVAEKWLNNPENLPEVNHVDGNKENNHYLNLQWVTRSQNIQHGFDTGLITPSMQGRKGKDSPRSKAVYQCDGLGWPIKEFGSVLEASRQTGINDGGIYDTCLGKAKSAGGYRWKYK